MHWLAQGHVAHLCIILLGDQRQINGLYLCMAVTSLINSAKYIVGYQHMFLKWVH